MSKFKVGETVLSITDDYSITRNGTKWIVLDPKNDPIWKNIKFEDNEILIGNQNLYKNTFRVIANRFKLANSHIIREKLGIK